MLTLLHNDYILLYVHVQLSMGVFKYYISTILCQLKMKVMFKNIFLKTYIFGYEHLVLHIHTTVNKSPNFTESLQILRVTQRN